MVVDRTFEVLSRKGIRVATGNGTRIRRGARADAGALARLHAQEIPSGFLPSLGDRFMRRLYAALVTDPDAVVLVAEDEGRLVGFAAGVGSVARFYRRFALRHGARAAVAAAPHLMRPGVLRAATETARYPGDTSGLPEAELVSIAVSPRFRRAGLGKQLVEGVQRDLAGRSVRELKVVVGSDNDSANAFYLDMGFAQRSVIAIHDGTTSNVLVATCSPRSS